MRGAGGYYRLGGMCTILLGATYLVIGLTYVVLPDAQRDLSFPYSQFLASFGKNPMPLTIQLWAFALGGILALAAIPAISEIVRPLSEGWVRWASNLALLGFAVTAITNLQQVAILPGRTAAFLGGDTSILARGPLTGLDPDGWLGFGGVGLWILIVNLLALRGGAWPKPLAYLGITGAFLAWLVVAGLALNTQSFVTVAAALGGLVVAPVWYAWVGLILRKDK